MGALGATGAVAGIVAVVFAGLVFVSALAGDVGKAGATLRVARSEVENPYHMA